MTDERSEALRVADMFSDDRVWLENQPGMAPWAHGCKNLAAALEERLAEHSTAVCAEPVDGSDHERAKPYRSRLWECMRHHWQDARGVTTKSEAPAQTVLNQLDEGRGFRGGGQLGGNPFRDVVLAVAMVQSDERAPRVFEKDYLPLIRGLAGKINYRLADRHQEWWNDLMDHLAGYTGGTAKLNKFVGQCGLTNWLPKVVWRFLKTRLKREAKHQGRTDIPDIGEEESSFKDSKAVAESLLCFVEVVAEALGALPEDDRLLFQLLYIEKMQNKDVAGVFGIAPGNITRRHHKAVERLRMLVTQFAEKQLAPETYDRLLQHSIGDSQAFAEALCEALQALFDVPDERSEDE